MKPRCETISYKGDLVCSTHDLQEIEDVLQSNPIDLPTLALQAGDKKDKNSNFKFGR